MGERPRGLPDSVVLPTSAVDEQRELVSDELSDSEPDSGMGDWARVSSTSALSVAGVEAAEAAESGPVCVWSRVGVARRAGSARGGRGGRGR